MARLLRCPPNVRYIDAALSNRTGQQLPRTVVKYARNQWGSTASTLKFEDIHPGKPPVLSTETVRWHQPCRPPAASPALAGPAGRWTLPRSRRCWRQVRGDSYDVREVLRETLKQNASSSCN